MPDRGGDRPATVIGEGARWVRQEGDPYRYGVYLLPDPRTSLAVTTATAAVRAQFGLVSAAAFPPHVTLVGSQHLGRDEAAVEAALMQGLAGRAPAVAHHNGVRPLGVGWVFDVNHLADGVTPNADLLALALAVEASVRPLRRPVAHPPSNDVDAGRFSAHLSLASHDLTERADLREEVGRFLVGLGLEVPTSFTADAVALYRTRSDDWSGRWWRTLTWEHLRSWRLAG